MEPVKRNYQKHKTDVKITVKHFLNTELKPEIDKRSGSLLYPLYVRVNVNRQLTKFRSRLNYYIPINDLNQLLTVSPTKQYADNERSIIEQTIREMNPEQKADFKLRNWSEYYKAGLGSLSESVYDFIMQKVVSTLRDTHQWKEHEIKNLNHLTIPEIFSFLSKVNVPEAKEIEEQYGVLLEAGTYEHLLQAVRDVTYDFCVWDGVYGFFQSQLLESGIPVTPKYTETFNKVIPLIKSL